MSTTVDPEVQQMVNNVFSYMTLNVGVNVLLGNIYTMQAHNDSLNEITNANQQLTEQWTSGGVPTTVPGDPNLYFLSTGLFDGPNPSTAGAEYTQNLQDFFDGVGLFSGWDGAGHYNGVSKWPYPALSQAYITHLLSLLSKYSSDEWIKGDGGGSTAVQKNLANDNTFVNSIGSGVSAQANLEEQPGQNLAKTESGVVSNDSGTQQTDTSILDAIQGWNGSISSLLQQSYAG